MRTFVSQHAVLLLAICSISIPALSELTYPTGMNPRWVTAADLNHDGKPDVVTASGTAVSVLLNRGDGRLLPHVDYALPGGLITIADINSDSHPDIVGVNDGAISVLLGNGDGTFQTSLRSHYSCGMDTIGLAFGDFDGDGNLDAAIAHGPPYKFAIMAGDGAGSFQLQSCGVEKIRDLRVLDLNHDGKLDIAAVNNGPGSSHGLQVLIGNGDGSFQPPVGYGPNQSLDSFNLLDLNHDGAADAVGITDSYLGTITSLLGKTDGTFVQTWQQGLHTGLWALVVSNFDQDANLDLVVLTQP